MKRIFTTSLLVTLLGAGLAFNPVIADDLEDRAAASREAAAKLLKALKEKVTHEAKTKGPVHAIGVCNLKALPITKEISEEMGFEVGRTSLLLRQPKNAPDEWEKKVMEDFLARKTAGEDLKTMEHYEVVEENGQKQFRYMKAIQLEGVCYNCHGSKLRKKVVEKLDELYPDDKARGMNPGDLRGAFTIRQTM